MKTSLRYVVTREYPRHRADMQDLWTRTSGHGNELGFDSFYVGNPAGEPFLGLCYDGETLVGQENYLPQNLAYAGVLYRGAMGVDTMIAPEYRILHGIFGKLCRLTIDELSTRVDFLFAYANEESKKYYLKYFNWRIADKIGVFKKAIGFTGVNAESLLALIRPGRRHRDLDLSEVSRFPGEILDPFVERYRTTVSHAFFHKSAAFLNWKFLQNRHYKTAGFLIHSEGRLCGYCVTYDAGVERRILDLVVEHNDPALFCSVLSHLAWASRAQGRKRLVVFAGQKAWYRPLLTRMCFFERGEIDLITLLFNADMPQSGWVVHCGDFDVF